MKAPASKATPGFLSIEVPLYVIVFSMRVATVNISTRESSFLARPCDPLLVASPPYLGAPAFGHSCLVIFCNRLAPAQYKLTSWPSGSSRYACFQPHGMSLGAWENFTPDVSSRLQKRSSSLTSK